MLNNLLNIVQGDGSYVAGQEQSSGNYYFDNIGEPFVYALIGFVVVFIGIVLIIGVIWLVGLLMKKTNNLEFLTKKRDKSVKVKEVKAEENPEAPAQSVVFDDVPDEVKAAIIAAIMAYYQKEEPQCQFRVKRIKRI